MQEEFPAIWCGETGKNICWKISGIRRTGRQVPRQADFWIIRFRNLTGQDLEFFEHLPTDGVLVGKINRIRPADSCFVPQEEITPDTCRESLFPALRLCHGAPGELRGISVCIRSFCCPIWKISMPQSCSAGTATSRSKENMPKKHT